MARSQGIDAGSQCQGLASHAASDLEIGRRARGLIDLPVDILTQTAWERIAESHRSCFSSAAGVGQGHRVAGRAARVDRGAVGDLRDGHLRRDVGGDGDLGRRRNGGHARGSDDGDVRERAGPSALVGGTHRASAAVAAGVVRTATAAGAAGHVTGEVLGCAAVVGVLVLTGCVAVARLDVDLRAIDREIGVAGGRPLQVHVDVTIGLARARPGDVLDAAGQPARGNLEWQTADELIA